MIKHNVKHAVWLINYWQTMISVLYNYQSWPFFIQQFTRNPKHFTPPLLQKYIYNHQNDIYVIKHNLDVTHTFTDEQWSVSFMNTHYNPPPLLGINFFTTVCTDPQTEGYSCFTGETVLGVLKPILKILFEIFHINFSTRIYLQIKDIGWIYEISLLLSVTCCNALL